MLFTYPTDDERFRIPEVVIHGTTTVGLQSIKEHGGLEAIALRVFLAFQSLLISGKDSIALIVMLYVVDK